MSETNFQLLPRKERLKALKDNSKEVSMQEYYLELSEFEISEREHEHSKKAIELESLDSEFKKIKAKYTEELKTLKDSMHTILHEIKEGKRHVRSECYLLPNFDTGKMEFYVDSGLKVKERELDPDEYQLSIK